MNGRWRTWSWQVIKSDAFLKPLEIEEGKVLDAYCKAWEESSPAQFLEAFSQYGNLLGKQSFTGKIISLLEDDVYNLCL